MQTYTGALQIKTITVEGNSKGTHNSGYVDILYANTLYINPCIDVVPVETDGVANYRFRVRVYWQGAILETHSMTAAGQMNVCSMSYPNKVFPPNQAWKTIPQLKGYEPKLPGFQLRVYNDEPNNQAYVIYSTFQLLSTAVFAKLT